MKKILLGLVLIAVMVGIGIIYGNMNPQRNVILLFVFIAFIASIVGLISIFIEEMPLILQLDEKKSQVAYMFFLGLLSFYAVELFLEQVTSWEYMYLLFAVMFLYISLENYVLKSKKNNSNLELLYGLTIALGLEIFKICINILMNPLDIDTKEIFINFTITLLVIIVLVFGIKIVEKISNKKGE